MIPAADGWFVLNVRDALWVESETFGAACLFDGPKELFAQVGCRLRVLLPGQPNGFYHRESNQEDFLSPFSSNSWFRRHGPFRVEGYVFELLPRDPPSFRMRVRTPDHARAEAFFDDLLRSSPVSPSEEFHREIMRTEEGLLIEGTLPFMTPAPDDGVLQLQVKLLMMMGVNVFI